MKKREQEKKYKVIQERNTETLRIHCQRRKDRQSHKY